MGQSLVLLDNVCFISNETRDLHGSTEDPQGLLSTHSENNPATHSRERSCASSAAVSASAHSMPARTPVSKAPWTVCGVASFAVAATDTKTPDTVAEWKSKGERGD